MKIFIGQKVRGEDITLLKEKSLKIENQLKDLGHEVHCTVTEDTGFSNMDSGEKIKHAFEIMDNCDTFLAIVRSNDKSEGLLIEAGYAFSKGMKIIVLIGEDVGRTTLRELADKVIVYKNEEDMLNKIKELK